MCSLNTIGFIDFKNGKLKNLELGSKLKMDDVKLVETKYKKDM